MQLIICHLLTFLRYNFIIWKIRSVADQYAKHEGMFVKKNVNTGTLDVTFLCYQIDSPSNMMHQVHWSGNRCVA